MANRECGGVLGAKKVFLVALATLPIGNSLEDLLTNTFKDLWSLWSSMVLYDPVRFLMVQYGPLWSCMVL